MGREMAGREAFLGDTALRLIPVKMVGWLWVAKGTKTHKPAAKKNAGQ